MEFPGRFSGLLGFPRFLVSRRSLRQGPRRNRRIVVEQRHTHECFAGIIEIAPLNLNISREQARFRIHLPFRLQRHDLLRDFFRVIRLVHTYLGGAKREQNLCLACWIGRRLQILPVGIFGLGEIL